MVYTSNLHSARCPRQTLPTVLMRQGLSHLNPLPVLHRQVYSWKYHNLQREAVIKSRSLNAVSWCSPRKTFDFFLLVLCLSWQQLSLHSSQISRLTSPPSLPADHLFHTFVSHMHTHTHTHIHKEPLGSFNFQPPFSFTWICQVPTPL